ncbi:MAG: DegT/DnrJ/EryC1/StrS family aminotransferase [Desulfarculus sp.]|jgi:dTDP-4-amino-4,6-dideoxygalactose transaminase|nr:MAG: DegT/DnrJ/EryC1/StrS family aminotransferase [Desulfarculus sp.]
MSHRPALSFSGLSEQYGSLQPEIERAALEVLRSGWYVLGRQVREFEREFAAYCGRRCCVSCASGTEALALALMALGVGPGDEVITVANTAVPTVSAISMVGARPVFADVNQFLLMNVEHLPSLVTERSKVILPVHLYGQVADMEGINALAQQYGLRVVEDACQAHGAEHQGVRAGAWGDLGCFSFYPTKNLGCYGDGGAVVTDREDIHDLLRKLRNYGQEQRYLHLVKGINSRLDEIQAAMLRVKLPHLDQWNQARRQVAGWYHQRLAGLCGLPEDAPGNLHVYHLYVIRTARRDDLGSHLARHGVQTLIHYPVPVHLQKAYADLGYTVGDLPATEQAAREILSLPMHPAMTQEQVDLVSGLIADFARIEGWQ